MNIVARVVVFVLTFFALVPCQFSAAQQSATVMSGQGFNPENPDSCNAPGECCPEPQQKPGQTGAAKGPITGGGNSNSLAGESKNHLALPGSDNAGQGMATCYYNYMTFVDPTFRIYILQPDPQQGSEQVNLGCWVPVPGGALVVWDKDAPGPCGEGCATLPVSIPAMHPTTLLWDWRPIANECICPITDLGSPSQGDNADFAPQGQLPAEPGKPFVFQSGRSGAQAWWYNPLNNSAPNSFIEVKHWDGTIARYIRHPGVKIQKRNSSGVAVREGSFWQLDRTTDPFDNVTVYTYDAYGQLARIAYPNGVYAHWNWTPSWKGNWGTRCSGIEIRHSAVATPPAWGLATDFAHEDSTFLVFENIDDDHTHFSGLPLAYFGQRGSYVPKPAAGQTYDVSAEASGHAVTEFVNDAAGQVTEVRRYWHPAGQPIAPTSGGRTTTLVNVYSANKIATQYQPHVGGVLQTNYFYGTPSSGELTGLTLPSGVTLSKHRTVNPDQSEKIQLFDPTNLRVYRTIILPGPAGRPRHAETVTAVQPLASEAQFEPEEVRIDYTYDATCVCQKPIRVERYVPRGTTKSGLHTTRFTYDPVTKWVTAVYSPNPATGSGAAEVVETTEYTFDAAAAWSPRWISRRVTTDGEVTFTYPNPMSRAGNLQNLAHGSMQGKVVETWKDVRVQTNLGTQATNDVVRTIVRNIPGNSAMAPLAYSGPQYPRGQVRVMHVDGVDETMQYDSTHGRLSAVYGGGTTTSFAHDWWGRLTTVVTNVGSSVAATWTITQNNQFQTKSEVLTGTAVETRYYYDFWGNLAVTLRKNASSTGGAPARHGMGSSARAWIREERLWTDSWLEELRVDRRPVDESDASPFSATNPLFLVTKYEYLFSPTMMRKVTAPNGAVSEETIDGFGMPFKTIVRESSAGSAPVLEVSRIYLDDQMNPVVAVKGSTGSPDSMRVTRIARNAAGAVTSITEPTRSAVPLYLGHIGGAKHEFDVDTSGRTMARRLKESDNDLVGEWSYSFDQLGRTIRTQATVLGTGSGAHVSIAKYKAGYFQTLQATQATDVAEVVRDYDGEGRLWKITDAAGNVTTYAYVPSTQLVASVSRLMIGSPSKTLVTSYVYDKMGRVTASSEGESSPLLTTTYAYTSLGHIERQTDAMGRVQKFLHDALGRMVDHVRVGDGSDFIRNTAEYVDSGLASSRTHVSQIDGNGAVTRTHFDFAGRRFLVHYPGADLNATPSVSAVTPTPQTSIVPVANTELYIYDGLSQVAKQLDGRGGVQLREYDASGRLILCRLEAVRDSIGIFNAGDFLHRDAFGRIVHAQSFSGLNGEDPVGTPVVYAGLLDTKTTYDSISRVHEESWATFFAPSQILKTKSSFGVADRFRSGLRYEDGLNLQNLDVGFGDDAVNRMTSVTWTRPGVGSGALPLAGYSWLGSMRQQRTSTYGGASPLATGVASYTYDQYGRMTQMKDDVTPSGGASVTRSKFDYTYNNASNLVKEEYAKVNGTKGDRFTYDAYHRLKDAYMGVNSAVMSAGADPTAFSATTMTQRVQYGIDNANNRTLVVEESAAGEGEYQYDLETPASTNPSNRYQNAHASPCEYDADGNMVWDGKVVRFYDYKRRVEQIWIPRLLAVAEQQAATQDGEKYIIVEGAEALETARKAVEEDVYQMMRRLPTEHTNPIFRSRLRAEIPGGVIRVPDPQSTSSSSSSSGGGMPGFIVPADLELVAVYGYDAFNRRVIRVVLDEHVGGAWVTSYDGWREGVEHAVVAGSSTQLQPVKQLVHGSDLDEILAYRRFNGTSWEDYHILHGGQDTAAKLVNQSGQVVEQYEYDPFGKATVYTAAGALVDVGPAGTSPEDGTRSAYGLMHLYKAMRLDPETGNCYVRNRYYDPRTGRFMSRDPIGVWGDAGNMGNEYAYAWNRPLVVGDALGLQGMPGPVVLPPELGLLGQPSTAYLSEVVQLLAAMGDVGCNDGPCPCAHGAQRIKDDAGRECCPEEMEEFTIYVEKPFKRVLSLDGLMEFARGGVPDPGHTFIGMGKFKVGFYPGEWWGGERGNFVWDDRHIFTHYRTYKVCPKTRDIILFSVLDDWLSEPVYDLRSSMSDPSTENCTTWACRMARYGGLQVPGATGWGLPVEPFTLADSEGFVPKPN